MKTLTALVAGAAFLTSAGLASAETALPLNPNKSSQAEIGLGSVFAGGTVTAIAAVGALFVITVVASDNTTSTTTVSTLALP